MGMPITIQIADSVSVTTFKKVFGFFRKVDLRFSTYKKNSEISQINRLEIIPSDYSNDMKLILKLAEKTKEETNDYFDIYNSKTEQLDPSGIVKGWAIFEAAQLLNEMEINNFFIDAGGDIQVSGKKNNNQNWKVGIKNPFNENEIVKVLELDQAAIATSGSYIRGDHIYNPRNGQKIDDVISLSVIGPNILEADRFATAAFAMGKKGIEFIEKLPGFEGYMIDYKGIATMTSGFEKYVV